MYRAVPGNSRDRILSQENLEFGVMKVKKDTATYVCDSSVLKAKKFAIHNMIHKLAEL